VSKALAKIRLTPSIPQARQRSEGDDANEPAIPKIPPLKSPTEAIVFVNFSFINDLFTQS
jgi:hypothetical protein